MSTSFFYRAKKWYSIFPGVYGPLGSTFLADHYRRRMSMRRADRVVIDALVGLGFLGWAGIRARHTARKYRLGEEWRRFAIRTARQNFVDPNDLALFRIDNAASVGKYVRRFEYAGLSKCFNPSAWTEHCILADKIAFAAICRHFALPHPQVYATVEKGEATIYSAPEQTELIVKIAGGQGGEGVRLHHLNSEHLDQAFQSLIADLKRHKRGRWLVQARERADANLADLALNALPTVRMTTMLNEVGKHEIVTCVIRLPSDPRTIIDNIKAGGLMAPVDIETGLLGEACRGRGVGDFSNHPVTGVPIEGRQLPHWPEAKALVLKAHSCAFRMYTMVGWDVALTPAGPVLIEGNGKPCMIVAQRAMRQAAGDTRLGELILYHLGQT